MICDVAATCGMHHCLRYNDDTMEEGGRARRGMLSDCFEAFLGALFLDRQPLGVAAVKLFCERMLFSLSTAMISGRRWMDPKTRLNYCLNEFNLRQPTHLRLQRTFKVIEEWGPSHEKMFVVGCYLNGQLVASARGQSLSDAQMGAARRATEELHLDDGLDIIPSQIMMGSEAVARSEALEPALPELKGPADGGGGGQKRAREEETPLEDFEASSMFAGARPGWAFRGGDRGTGYYRDRTE